MVCGLWLGFEMVFDSSTEPSVHACTPDDQRGSDRRTCSKAGINDLETLLSLTGLGEARLLTCGTKAGDDVRARGEGEGDYIPHQLEASRNMSR